MSDNGWYYLHTNGELIYKPSPDACMDIRDSDFARAMWSVGTANRLTGWCILVEALCLGAKKDRIIELAEKWKCNDEDAKNFASFGGFVFEKDGNQWCAHKKDFKNLQESPCGFGDTCLEASANLCKSLGFIGGKMNWHANFLDLVK